MKRTFLTVLAALLLAFSLAAQTATAPQTAGAPPAKEDPMMNFVKAAKPEVPPADIKVGFDTISAKSSLAMLTFIASDLLEGREAGTRGYQLAAEYAASLFGTWDLKPLGDAARRDHGPVPVGRCRVPARAGENLLAGVPPA